MKISSFINSNDIREHIEKVGYEFNSLEAAWLVYQCKSIDLQAKQEAFKEIINTMPDCEIPERYNSALQKSLHEFLKKYIDIQNKYIDKFYDNNDNHVYMVNYKHITGEYYDTEDVYPSFEKLKNDIDIEHDSEIVSIRCVKYIFTNTESKIDTHFSTDMKMFEIHPTISSDDEDYAIYYEVFDRLFFNFPVPFKEGDIVCNKFKTNQYYDGPFVLTRLGFPYITDDTPYGLGDCGDSMDMTAEGYFQYEDGTVFFEVMHEYMDLEYYIVPDTGVRRILTGISNYIQDKISLPLLLSAHQLILAENQVENDKPIGFTEEGLKLAGL